MEMQIKKLDCEGEVVSKELYSLDDVAMVFSVTNSVMRCVLATLLKGLPSLADEVFTNERSYLLSAVAVYALVGYFLKTEGGHGIHWDDVGERFAVFLPTLDKTVDLCDEEEPADDEFPAAYRPTVYYRHEDPEACRRWARGEH